MKRSSSHVGTVLSFVIFIVFLVFVFTIIEPAIKTQNSKQTLLDFLKLSLTDKLQTTDEPLVTLIITLSEGGSKDCSKVTAGFIKKLVDDGELLLLKDDLDNIINYDTRGGQFIIDIPSDYSGTLRVYYGSEVDDSLIDLGEPSCDVVKTTTGYIIEESEQIFSKSMFDLLLEFGEKYDLLKQELGIPNDSEFTFSFLLANGSIIEPENVVIPNTNVYASTVPVQYFDVTASELQIGLLTIKVW